MSITLLLILHNKIAIDVYKVWISSRAAKLNSDVLEMDSSPVGFPKSMVRTPSSTEAESRSNARQDTYLIETMDIALQK